MQHDTVVMKQLQANQFTKESDAVDLPRIHHRISDMHSSSILAVAAAAPTLKCTLRQMGPNLNDFIARTSNQHDINWCPVWCNQQLINVTLELAHLLG